MDSRFSGTRLHGFTDRLPPTLGHGDQTGENSRHAIGASMAEGGPGGFGLVSRVGSGDGNWLRVRYLGRHDPHAGVGTGVEESQ